MATTSAERKQVLFIQGGGEDGYTADATLVASLREALGSSYEVHYPEMPDEDAPDFGWQKQIGKEIAAIGNGVIVVGHSLGASILLKYLAENTVENRIAGIFLISTPYWGGDEVWQYDALTLQDDFADKLPKSTSIFLYHSKDDEEADVAHVAMYAQKLPQATVRTRARGGHQFGNDLSQVALDIKSLG